MGIYIYISIFSYLSYCFECGLEIVKNRSSKMRTTGKIFICQPNLSNRQKWSPESKKENQGEYLSSKEIYVCWRDPPLMQLDSNHKFVVEHLSSDCHVLRMRKNLDSKMNFRPRNNTHTNYSSHHQVTNWL